MMSNSANNRTAIYVSLVVGLAIIVASGIFYLNQERARSLREAEFENLLNSQQQESSNAAAEEAAKNFQLDQCLNDVDTRFSNVVKDSPSLTVDEWKLILEFIQNQKDDCYRRYQ